MRVGTVEVFQGDERRVIILSTVRSVKHLAANVEREARDFFAFDQRHNLGFIGEPKRFNVAITRPQALLIVIGNPYVLASDSKNWNKLLQFALANRCYTGARYTPHSERAAVFEQAARDLGLHEPDELDLAADDGDEEEEDNHHVAAAASDLPFAREDD